MSRFGEDRGDRRSGGDWREVGEGRMFWEVAVTAALSGIGGEFLNSGIALYEPLLLFS